MAGVHELTAATPPPAMRIPMNSAGHSD